MKKEKSYNDLREGQKNFALFPKYINGKINEICFNHYRKTENFNEVDQEINDQDGCYFLRKGFSSAIKDLDENILKPILTDGKGKDFNENLEKKEILEKIYENKIGVSGFKVSKEASPADVAAEYIKLVDAFVETAHNQDLSGAANRNEFMIRGLDQFETNQFVFSNENPNEQIDVQEILNELKLDDAVKMTESTDERQAGIRAKLEYGQMFQKRVEGLDNPIGINIRFNYENDEQKKYLKNLFDSGDFAQYQGKTVLPYLTDDSGKFSSKGTQVGGAQIDSSVIVPFLKRFVELDKMELSAGNITIKEKFDETAQKALKSVVDNMRAGFNRSPIIDGGHIV
jgi:hypothetical protein